MEQKFIDDLFGKIVDGRFDKTLPIAAVKAKLSLLEDVKYRIKSLTDDDTVENVLGYREVKRSLEQCLDFIENKNSSVEDVDFVIYLSFATTRLKKAESIIDSEFSELSL